MADIDLFLFRQTNKYIIDYLPNKIKIPAGKTHLYLEDVVNTSGSTIPLLLSDAWRAGKVRLGANILGRRVSLLMFRMSIMRVSSLTSEFYG